MNDTIDDIRENIKEFCMNGIPEELDRKGELAMEVIRACVHCKIEKIRKRDYLELCEKAWDSVEWIGADNRN